MNDKLNEKLWDENQQLLPDVRDKLKEIVDEFIQYILDDKVKLSILDVHLVGSNCGFNYTELSDLDVHLIVNFDDIGNPDTLVQAYCNAKRTRFNNEHNIEIKGIPVELYIEDVNAITLSNGIYSLVEDKWIKKPVKDIEIHEVNISEELKSYRQVIDEALNSNNSDYLRYVYNKLFMIRRNGLAINGEYSKGNQLFKTLRNDGTIDKIRNKLNETIDKELSLESLNESYKDSEEFKQLSRQLHDLSIERDKLKDEEPEVTYPSDEEMRIACGFDEDTWKSCSRFEKKTYYEMFSGSNDDVKNHDEWFSKYNEVSNKISDTFEKMKKLQKDEFEKQNKGSKLDFPKEATKNSYEGFKLDTDEYHQDYLENLDYAKQKGYQGCFIAEMTPDEYMERCSKQVFETPIEDVHDGMEEKDKISEYAEMMKNGTQFNMPYIDVKNQQQEGRHRAMAAKQLGIDKIPVLYCY